MKYIVFLILFSLTSALFGQESLLLGEQRLDEVYFEARTDGTQKINFYQSKYRGDKPKKDSTLVGFETYTKAGFIQSKASFTGKNGINTNTFNYDFQDGLMSEYSFLAISEEGNYGRAGEFSYDSKKRLILQKHALSDIKYSYAANGTLHTKSYFYNNGDPTNSEPWVHYYFYDDNLNLIHVDTDPECKQQTSFYDEHNQLIKHDYYPGVAYSSYEYDSLGNCKIQRDYELVKNKWIEQTYCFSYDDKGNLISSGSLNKKGKCILSEERFYLQNGELDYIIYLKKGKRKWMKTFNYLPFEA